MSLVTTAIEWRSRIALQRRSTRAVFPEPTGAPIPTRSTEGSLMGSPSSISGTEEPGVLGLVERARDREARRGRADAVVVERRGGGHQPVDAAGLGEEQPLAVGLSQRDQLDRGAHLALEPGECVAAR